MRELPTVGVSEVEVFEQDGYLIEVWRQNGEHHRVGGPAVTYHDPETGKKVALVWKKNGVPHRVGGPAHIQINPENDVVVLEEHYKEGKLHRIGYAARIVSDHLTGRPNTIESYVNGEQVYRDFKVGRLGTPGFEFDP